MTDPSCFHFPAIHLTFPTCFFNRSPLLPSSPLIADASASLGSERSALARKRFTLQGLSNRRSLPAGNGTAPWLVSIWTHLSSHSDVCLLPMFFKIHCHHSLSVVSEITYCLLFDFWKECENLKSFVIIEHSDSQRNLNCMQSRSASAEDNRRTEILQAQANVIV